MSEARPAPSPVAPARLSSPVTPTYPCEADVAPGLEELAADELRRVLGARLGPVTVARPGTLAFDYSGDLAQLLLPRTVLAIYLIQRFAVPRPRALLGDEHFRALVRQIAAVRALAPPETFGTLYLSAAGSDSSVLSRLKEELGKATGLRPTPPAAHEGDLHLRLRRAATGTGWETLARLTSRPLGARPWRVQNLEGALNATVARAMVLLTGPDPRDQFLNLACGSGTLLIERAAWGPAKRLIGVDNSAEALAIAAANVATAGYAERIELVAGDARTLDLPDASIDALCADLPFGHLVGTHDENLTLYPAILAEAARVARREAPLILLTHEVRLMERLLADSAEWALDQMLRVTLGGLHPRIFALRRR
jgi:23S rRNA G2445 N2-methylase RlmL